jgi:hypothetical protein
LSIPKAKLKFRWRVLAGFIFQIFAARVGGSTLHVDINSINPTPPYTNWATAANIIQDAVDLAAPNDLVLVTNGIYQTGGRAIQGSMTNRVAVTKPIILKSVNGSAVTVIQGHQIQTTTNGDAAIRCVYLTNGASLAGFTLTGGATRTNGDWQEQSGGGIWYETLSGVAGELTNYPFISDCVISNDSAYGSGGGVSGGVLSNCTLIGNWSSYGGGAAFALLNSCLVISNSVGTDSGEGGGVGSCVLNACTVSGNVAHNGGGSAGGTMTNCVLRANFASGMGGGAATTGASGQCVLYNCTVVGNVAGNWGGGLDEPSAINCIVYDNIAPSSSNYFAYRPDVVYLNYSCTAPLPAAGLGNFTNPPLFVDEGGRDFHLQTNSPCINSGNNSAVSTSTDRDDNSRISGGTVDTGAFEFQNPGSMISYAWLQQYGFETDGSADFIDSDHDGMNNWKEWVAGTNPTNAASVLALLPPITTISNTTLRWKSVSNRTYFMQRSGDLVGQTFTTVQSDIAGQETTTTFIDSQATNTGSYFYRVGVQP